MSTEQPPARSPWPVVVGAVSLVAHAVVGVLYLGTGLVAPVGAVIGLGAVWLALLVVGLRWTVARSWWTPAVPVAAAVTWVVVVATGERLLGWTA